jgi:hypothetical protein
MVYDVKMVRETGSDGQMQKQRDQRNEKEGSGERGRMKQEHHLNLLAVYRYLILCRINFLFRMVCCIIGTLILLSNFAADSRSTHPDQVMYSSEPPNHY